jgi:hypothetical protein
MKEFVEVLNKRSIEKRRNPYPSDVRIIDLFVFQVKNKPLGFIEHLLKKMFTFSITQSQSIFP